MPGHFDSFGIQIQVCYVAFWDEVTVSTQESAEHRIGEDGFIGDWLIVVVRDLPFTDQRLNGKILKLLAHRLFPHSKYSIWVDLKSQMEYYVDFPHSKLHVLRVLRSSLFSIFFLLIFCQFVVLNKEPYAMLIVLHHH